MKYSLQLQLLSCLMLYTSCVHAIMVKFGTKDGPIEPPAPTPVVPVPRPYRSPAPVWEARDDTPDPNAKWRPPLFAPNPLYTQVIFTAASTPPPQNSAQRFVNSYVPTTRPFFQPIQAQKPSNYLTPAQILSSQSLPGFGTRYFVPAYIEISRDQNRQEDRKYNDVETNEIDGASSRLTDSDFQWKYEKDASRRDARRTTEGVARHQYQWPLYVLPRHQQ